MSKETLFSGKPPSRSTERIDQAFHGIEVKEPTKRITVDVPTSLHARIKIHCVMEGVGISELIRHYLEERFPA